VRLDELSQALEDLTEPRGPDVAAARAAVRRRVRRAHVRWAAVAAGTALVAVVVGVLAIGTGGSTPSVHTVGPANPPTTVFCNRIPVAVERGSVPAGVIQWSGDTAVIGSGSLWTRRANTAVAPIPLDGGWYLKFPWYTQPLGLPDITGRRLDGPGTFHADANYATDTRGTWIVSGLNFSTAGCWEVTARYAHSSITFDIEAGRTPTAGSVPDSPNGPVDLTKVPEYIETLDRSGKVVGYTRKEDVYAAAGTVDPNSGISRPIPVYALDDLHKIVGHMYPSRGFVRVGRDPADVPTIPAHTPAG
jgi:hypothetical protein